MANVSVIWDNDDKTVLRYVFAKDYSWSDFRKAIDEAAVMLDTIDHKADVIMDLTSASLLPSGAITQGKWLFANTPHANIGQTVVVGANTLIQAIVDTSRRLSRQRADNWKLLFTSSVEDARKLLAQNTAKSKEATKIEDAHKPQAQDIARASEDTKVEDAGKPLAQNTAEAPDDTKGKAEGQSQVQ